MQRSQFYYCRFVSIIFKIDPRSTGFKVIPDRTHNVLSKSREKSPNSAWMGLFSRKMIKMPNLKCHRMKNQISQTLHLGAKMQVPQMHHMCTNHSNVWQIFEAIAIFV